jgi:hypothetical protein
MAAKDPTLIVHGRKGDWTATIDGLGDFYCCHEMFLTGDEYDQDCTGSTLKNRIKKKRQMEAIKEQRHVIITRDIWERPPGDPGPGGRYRRAPGGGCPYVGFYEAYNPSYVGCHLRFTRGARLCLLIRPCDL